MFNKYNKNNKKKTSLAFWLILWLVFTFVVFLVTFPKIKQSIIDSNVLSLMESYKNQEEPSKTREITLFYIQKIENNFLVQPVFTKIPKYGGTIYQDALEALLTGPSSDLQNEGFVSLFPSKTTLIGSTLADGIYFIDFSKQFDKISEENRALCLSQIEKTLKLINPDIREIRISLK